MHDVLNNATHRVLWMTVPCVSPWAHQLDKSRPDATVLRHNHLQSHTFLRTDMFAAQEVWACSRDCGPNSELYDRTRQRGHGAHPAGHWRRSLNTHRACLWPPVVPYDEEANNQRHRIQPCPRLRGGCGRRVDLVCVRALGLGPPPPECIARDSACGVSTYKL